MDSGTFSEWWHNLVADHNHCYNNVYHPLIKTGEQRTSLKRKLGL